MKRRDARTIFTRRLWKEILFPKYVFNDYNNRRLAVATPRREPGARLRRMRERKTSAPLATAYTFWGRYMVLRILASTAALACLFGGASFAFGPSKGGLPVAASHKSSNGSAAADPFLWLEEVNGTRALDWVKAENAKTLASCSKIPTSANFWRTQSRSTKQRTVSPRLPS